MVIFVPPDCVSASPCTSVNRIVNPLLTFHVDLSTLQAHKTYIRELKQATFLSTRTSTGSKPRRYRWQVMASAVLV